MKRILQEIKEKKYLHEFPQYKVFQNISSFWLDTIKKINEE